MVLSNRERLSRLIKNHNEHLNSIMLNFANQFHQLTTIIEEEEGLKHTKKTVDSLGIPYKNEEVKK